MENVELAARTSMAMATGILLLRETRILRVPTMPVGWKPGIGMAMVLPRAFQLPTASTVPGSLVQI